MKSIGHILFKTSGFLLGLTLLISCSKEETVYCPGSRLDRLPIEAYPKIGARNLFESSSGQQVFTVVTEIDTQEPTQETCTRKMRLFHTSYDDCYVECQSTFAQIRASNTLEGVNQFDLSYYNANSNEYGDDYNRQVHIHIGNNRWWLMVDPLESRFATDTIYKNIILGDHTYDEVIKLNTQNQPEGEVSQAYIYYHRNLGVVAYKLQTLEEVFYRK